MRDYLKVPFSQRNKKEYIGETWKNVYLQLLKFKTIWNPIIIIIYLETFSNIYNWGEF